jgi:hypothetical protein
MSMGCLWDTRRHRSAAGCVNLGKEDGQRGHFVLGNVPASTEAKAGQMRKVEGKELRATSAAYV